MSGTATVGSKIHEKVLNFRKKLGKTQPFPQSDEVGFVVLLLLRYKYFSRLQNVKNKTNNKYMMSMTIEDLLTNYANGQRNFVGIHFNVEGSRTKLKGADLRGINLMGAYLFHVYLVEANLADSCLIGANLSHAVLVKANLSHANLVNTNLHRSNLHSADLSRCDLESANLSWARLQQTNLLYAT